MVNAFKPLHFCFVCCRCWSPWVTSQNKAWSSAPGASFESVLTPWCDRRGMWRLVHESTCVVRLRFVTFCFWPVHDLVVSSCVGRASPFLAIDLVALTPVMRFVDFSTSVLLSLGRRLGPCLNGKNWRTFSFHCFQAFLSRRNQVARLWYMDYKHEYQKLFFSFSDFWKNRCVSG
jgi:hypothetical protein